jgi:hypothetical protein
MQSEASQFGGSHKYKQNKTNKLPGHFSETSLHAIGQKIHVKVWQFKCEMGKKGDFFKSFKKSEFLILGKLPCIFSISYLMVGYFLFFYTLL